jgi:hypothetical protein
VGVGQYKVMDKINGDPNSSHIHLAKLVYRHWQLSMKYDTHNITLNGWSYYKCALYHFFGSSVRPTLTLIVAPQTVIHINHMMLWWTGLYVQKIDISSGIELLRYAMSTCGIYRAAALFRSELPNGKVHIRSHPTCFVRMTLTE